MKVFVLIIVLGTLSQQVPLAESQELPLIINGQEAKPHSAPYIAYLQAKETYCGAVILNANWVVTAAHCFGAVKIIAGAHDTTKPTGNEQYRSPVKEVKHEGFPDYPAVAQHDIRLIRVDKPFTFNQFVSAIDLPPQNKVHTGTGTLFGWGYYKPLTPSPVLRTANMPIIPNAECQKLPAVSDPIYPTQLCAGPKDGTVSSCGGDSGCPFVQIANGKPELVGLVSWGRGDCVVNGIPSVLTRVSSYIQWINKNMK